MPRTRIAALRERRAKKTRGLQPQPSASARAPSTRILVVEDDSLIRRLLAEVFAEEGYLVEQAVNGAEALLKLQPTRPHVIVLDLMMPIMNGWEFARACHARSEDDAIPIVIMSASPDLAQAAEQLQPYGVRAAVAKPFDVEILLAVVGRLASRTAAVEWPG